jgi:hypothetical protein
MDTANQPRQEKPPKLSATARYERLKQKEKETRVATVGANYPALAASRGRRPKNPEITSHSLRRTSPRRSPAVAMSLQAMALLTQKGGNAKMSILTPRVILPQPPVLDVDVDDDADEDKSIVSSDELSADTSTGGGTRITGKETTMVGEVEGEYPPLPEDYTFNYSANGGGYEPDGDNDDDDLEINLTDEQLSKYNFFEPLAHYLDGHRITNCNCKAVELAIAAKAGTYVRGLDPMKRAKQEDIFMHKYLHVVNQVKDDLFEHEQVREAMLLNYKGAKKKGGGGSLLQLCIGNRRQKLITYANLRPNFKELVTCLNYRVVRHR